MASPSIMRSTYTHAQRAGIPNTRVTTPHDHELRFSYCSECAYDMPRRWPMLLRSATLLRYSAPLIGSRQAS
jgi:hypothetical protein